MAPKAGDNLSPMSDASIRNMSPRAREWDEEDDNVAEFTCSLFSPRNWGGGNHVDERDDVLSAGPSLGSPVSAASMTLNPIQDKRSPGLGPTAGKPIQSPANDNNLDKDVNKKVAFVEKNPTPLSPLSLPPDDDDEDDEDTLALDDDKKASLLTKATHRGAIGIRPPTPKAGKPPPSPTRTPVANQPKMVQIPDDESEASLMVLMRYMGCTPKAYGERPTQSNFYGCGLNTPTGKEFVCDSDDDQDTMLTDDYETDNSIVSMQDPSQSWTKLDDSEELVGNSKLVKLSKGAKKEEKAGVVKDITANLGSIAVEPKVSSMKSRVNLTVDTSREKDTKKPNDAVEKVGSVSSPAAASPRSDAVAQAVAAVAMHKHIDVSPRSDATSPTLAEAMAAVASFKKSSVDAISPMSTESILSRANIAEKVAAVSNVKVASSSTPTVASIPKPKPSTLASPSDSVRKNNLSSVAAKSAKSTRAAELSPSKTSPSIVAGKKKKATPTLMDKKIKSPSVASPSTTKDAMVKPNAKVGVEGKKKKNTPIAKKVKSPSVAASSSISDTIVQTNETTKISVKGKKQTMAPAPSEDEVKSTSLALPSSDATIEAADISVEGTKKDDSLSDKNIKSPSVATPSLDSGAIIEAPDISIEVKKKKGIAPSDKKSKSPSVTETVKSSAEAKKKKGVANSGKTVKSPSSATQSSDSGSIVEAATNISVKEKKKKDVSPSEKKKSSSSPTSLVSTLNSVDEVNTKKSIKRTTKQSAGTVEKKTNTTSAATPSSTSDTNRESAQKAGSGQTTQSAEANNITASAVIESKPSSNGKNASLTVNTDCANKCEGKSSALLISPISPCTRSVREVDELLSQTREWLARHSETHPKKQDGIATKGKKDKTPSLLESSLLEQRTVVAKETLQEVTNPNSTRPMSPQTLSDLLHSKKGNGDLSPISPSSPLFALSSLGSCPSSPTTGKSIKEQLEEIRAKQRELELRQKAKLGQQASLYTDNITPDV